MRMLEMHHLAKSETFNDEILDKIHDERKFPITNLERMYDNPYVQESFGFSFDSNGKFRGSIGKNEFLKGFRKLIEDITTGEIDSRKTNTSKQIQKYIEDLPDENRPNLKRKGKLTSKDFKEVKVDKNTIKSFRSSPKPAGLFLPGHIPFKLKNTSL